MAGALAQHQSGTNFGTTCAATFGTATTGPRLLTMTIQDQQATDCTGVTDTAGNTWQKAISLFVTNQKHVEIWYAKDAASCTTVTATLGPTTSANANMSIQEWSGSAGWTYRASTTVANGSGTDPAQALATCQSGDIILTALGYLESTSGTRQDTLTSGTALDSLARGNTAFACAYKITTSSTTDGCAWSMSTAVSSALATASFGPVAGGTAPVADAGTAQTVEPFTTVTLSAAATTGTVTGYAWTLVSNTSSVTPTLSSTTSIAPTYTAPGDFYTGATLVWRVTATNGTGSTTATVTHTIKPATRGLVVAGPAIKALRRTLA